jgi:ADP-Ribosyltransferase in polyvalent proteins
MRWEQIITEQRDQAFERWFGNSKVVDKNGKPQVVYHGTAADFDAFDTKFMYSGEGGSHTGSGFYFTTNPESASNYASMKAGGGNVMPVYLSIKNPLYIDWDSGEVSGAKISLTRNQIKKIILSVPNIRDEDSPLMNHGDIEYTGFNKVLNDAIGVYANNNNLAALRNDFFPDDHDAWLKALSAATGHDGAMTVTPNGDVHWVAWRPEQIKSAIGNIGTFDPKSSSIVRETDK